MLAAALSLTFTAWLLCLIVCATWRTDPWDDAPPSWRWPVYVFAAAPFVICALLVLGLYKAVLWSGRRIKTALEIS